MHGVRRWWLVVVWCLLVGVPPALARADPPDVAPVPAPADTRMNLDLHGPPGSQAFGYLVATLPNGNLLVTDPGFDRDGVADVGAILLYDGATHQLISMVTGSQSGDYIGAPKLWVLPSGNVVVLSKAWAAGSTPAVGALTWINATTGLTGTVSAANSLVGSHAHDFDMSELVVLTNGNYVLSTPAWDNGAVANAGAATWGSGSGGRSGAIAPATSLVGMSAFDMVGRSIVPLANGSYLVSSHSWDNGAVADAGALTWGDGTRGLTGTISAANSLIGSTTDERVGDATALTNGNYVARTPWWDNGALADAGALTWGDGTRGVAGTITAANSLVGTTGATLAGLEEVVALTNGNYVTLTPRWRNAAGSWVGAATWGDGATGTVGPIAAANSLTGSGHDDMAGGRIVPLTNGNYVVLSPHRGDGAVTWANGSRPTAGVIADSNSLVGSRGGDQIGLGGVIPLINGNYVVLSPRWDNGALQNAGAVTWGDGARGTLGPVSVANSLVGPTAFDYVGWSVEALANGNYVVDASLWHDSAGVQVGAVTWGDGARGTLGPVSVANSLVGTRNGDMWGADVVALTTGHYVVSAPAWDNGGIVDAGAVTWGDGTRGTVGMVSASTSLVGSRADDWVGTDVVALVNGNYVVSSPRWDNGPLLDAGAATWVNGARPAPGVVSPANSLVGTTAGELVSGWGPEGSKSGIRPEPDGSYVVNSAFWGDEKGAYTVGGRLGGVRGPITQDNSTLGKMQRESGASDVMYDGVHQRLVAGWWQRNLVEVVQLSPPPHVHYLPHLRR